MDDHEDVKINSELYEALMKKDDEKVLEICASIPKGPLHTITIHDDTVIHLAVFHKKTQLALSLLDMVDPKCDSHKLTWQNGGGSTILHETGTNNKTLSVAKELLRRAPGLLSIKNKLGETALFYAARHGKTKIFKYLHDEVMRTNQGPDIKTFLTRGDKSTILHLAILSNNYWVAHEIATKHKQLMHEKDEDEMTPLQLLSCRKLELLPKGYFTRMLYDFFDPNVVDTSWMLHPLKKFRKGKFKHEWGMKLIKLLVKEDTSWEDTESRLGKNRAKYHQYGKNSFMSQQPEEIYEDPTPSPQTPLLLATKHGCVEIVEEILKEYPQSIEHIDEDGRNILHVTIINGNDDILELLMSKKIITERLRGKIDKDANTLLHMVGEEVKPIDAELKGPAFVLQKKMRRFRKVETISTYLDKMKLNSKSKTPEQVFNENNNQLRLEAKDWMVENSKNYTVVAVLIATVAFAAAYTVPGGPDPNTGQPVLKKKPLFFFFTIADALSLSAALTSVIMFLNIITSSYRFKDFEKNLVRKMDSGLAMLTVSVVMLMVAFAVTLILTISSGRKWTDIFLYAVSFFPVLVFVLSSVDYSKISRMSVFRKSKDMIRSIRSKFARPKPAVWYSGVRARTTPPPPPPPPSRMI